LPHILDAVEMQNVLSFHFKAGPRRDGRGLQGLRRAADNDGHNSDGHNDDRDAVGAGVVGSAELFISKFKRDTDVSLVLCSQMAGFIICFANYAAPRSPRDGL
jgi:hypothetical protein